MLGILQTTINTQIRTQYANQPKIPNSQIKHYHPWPSRGRSFISGLLPSTYSSGSGGG